MCTSCVVTGAGWIDVWLFNGGDYRGGIALQQYYQLTPTENRMGRFQYRDWLYSSARWSVEKLPINWGVKLSF